MLGALQELVRDCTAFNPDARPTMKQVLERIRQLQRLYDPKAAAGALAPTQAAARHTAGSSSGAAHGSSKTGLAEAAGGAVHAHHPASIVPVGAVELGEQAVQDCSSWGCMAAAQGRCSMDGAALPAVLHKVLAGDSPAATAAGAGAAVLVVKLTAGVTDPAIAAAIAAANSAAASAAAQLLDVTR